MKKTIFVCFIVAIAMTAWKQPADNVTVDTLIAQWNNAWNNHDAKAIMNLMDDNVVFFAGTKTRMKGKHQIKESLLTAIINM